MATAAVTNTFVASTPAEAAQVNTNFTDLVTFLNNSVVHRDGSKAMASNFDAGTNKIVNLVAGTTGTDAVNKTQMEAALAARLPSNKSVIAGTYVGTTDPSGNIAVPYGTTFSSAPIFVAVNGDASAGDFSPQIVSTGTTTATITTRITSSITIRIDWVAVGVLA